MSRNPELRLIASKGWVVRATKSLNELLEKPDITVVTFNDAIDEFDKRLASFDDIQSELELTIETEEALLDCVNKAADFREKARVSRVNAASKLLELTQSDQDAVDKSTCVSTADVKLPKLTLPKFSGDVLEWQSFWDQFKVNVHHSDLPVVSKFSYLLSLLQGEAKQAVQGLSMTSDHYKTACKILEDRYGRTERIIFTHIQKLLNISIPSKCSISVLWKLNDDLQAHTRSLSALGIDGDKYGVILTPLILSRLPQDIRLEWSREGKGHESDLTFLLEFLQSEIQRRERSHVFKEAIASPSSLVTEEKRNVKVATASALQASSIAKTCKTAQSFSCGICSKHHSTDRCFKLLHVPVGTRKEKLRSAGLCFRCLKSGHIARGCSACCIHCQGRHHALLCNPMTSDPGVTSNVSVEQTQPKMPNKDVAKPSNHIPLVLQVFHVQLTMLCRLAGLVHVFYCSQFESRSMVSGAWSMLRFFLIRGRIVPILQRIWCVRWVRNGLMHSPCLTLLLGLVSPVSVNYATFTMLYWKVHKVLAIPCIARRFLWYVRQFIVPRCLPTWCQHLVSCSLLMFMVQVRRSRLIFL